MHAEYQLQTILKKGSADEDVLELPHDGTLDCLTPPGRHKDPEIKIFDQNRPHGVIESEISKKIIDQNQLIKQLI